MVHYSVGLDNLFSPPKIPQLPRNLNPFYNENRANSDTSNCKEVKKEEKDGATTVGAWGACGYCE